jgi:hypothetical protein
MEKTRSFVGVDSSPDGRSVFTEISERGVFHREVAEIVDRMKVIEAHHVFVSARDQGECFFPKTGSERTLSFVVDENFESYFLRRRTDVLGVVDYAIGTAANDFDDFVSTIKYLPFFVTRKCHEPALQLTTRTQKRSAYVMTPFLSADTQSALLVPSVRPPGAPGLGFRSELDVRPVVLFYNLKFYKYASVVIWFFSCLV